MVDALSVIAAIIASGYVVIIRAAPAGYRIVIMRPSCGKIIVEHDAQDLATALNTIGTTLDL
jgi:hypothetical protein